VMAIRRPQVEVRTGVRAEVAVAAKAKATAAGSQRPPSAGTSSKAVRVRPQVGRRAATDHVATRLIGQIPT
jgi:hypothetical protein